MTREPPEDLHIVRAMREADGIEPTFYKSAELGKPLFRVSFEQENGSDGDVLRYEDGTYSLSFVDPRVDDKHGIVNERDVVQLILAEEG